MPRTHDPARVKAKQLSQELGVILRHVLGNSDYADLMSCAKQPSRRPAGEDVGKARVATASYLMHTKDSRLPANGFGMSLKGIRAVLVLLDMEHYEQYIWTRDIEKRRQRTASTV